MSAVGSVSVRVFGDLRVWQRERGRPTSLEADIPLGGIAAHDLALELELPVEKIEGVFCNHTVYGLAHVVMPGDEVAFVPYGTPGPHRFFLGLYKAGREEDEPSG